MRVVLWRRQRLLAQVSGSGPPVILVHNAGADHRVWEPVAATLARHYTVWLPDLPGFGRSDKPRTRYDLDTFADALGAVVDAAGPRVGLVGICVGGAAAWRFTERSPERVAALGVVHPATWKTLSAGPIVRLHNTLHRPERRALALRFLERAWSLLRRPVVDRLTHTPLAPPRRRAVDEALSAPHTLRVLAAILADLPSFAALDSFTRTPETPPAFVGWGAQGPLVPPAGLPAVVRQLEPISVLDLPHSGHLAPLEQPDTLSEGLMRFLHHAEWR